MKIAVLKERLGGEKRVAATPESVKKLIQAGFKVSVEKDAGKDAGFLDTAYKEAGASIEVDLKSTLKGANLIFKINCPSDEELIEFPEKSTLIGMLKPYTLKQHLKAFKEKKLTTIALELVPRISRAQSMDVLSSQSSLVGYRGVLEAAHHLNRSLPMMMTAAGTIPPAKVLILGAGVAGLQAIATAKRMGARVFAFDVRSAAKEQVESLGGTFVQVEFSETGEGQGGYAKEMSDAYKKAQSDKLAEVVKEQDIIISTAQIPGKPSPILITEAMVKSMKKDSVIVDLAAEGGGNCELTEMGKTITKHGVTIIGHTDLSSRISYDSSSVYARNLCSFVLNAYPEKDKVRSFNLEDEIVKASTMMLEGNLLHTHLGGE